MEMYDHGHDTIFICAVGEHRLQTSFRIMGNYHTGTLRKRSLRWHWIVIFMQLVFHFLGVDPLISHLIAFPLHGLLTIVRIPSLNHHFTIFIIAIWFKNFPVGFLVVRLIGIISVIILFVGAHLPEHHHILHIHNG